MHASKFCSLALYVLSFVRYRGMNVLFWISANVCMFRVFVLNANCSLLLADRAAARNMIGYCPSLCPPVTLCIFALRVGVEGYKLYHRVSRMELPLHFFRHFCYATTQRKTEPPKFPRLK